jgi:SAM-dependent methyltransferase
VGRSEREREFHDHLGQGGFEDRRLINRLAASFYEKREVLADAWRQAGDLAGRSVLDFGCGSGEFSYELARRGAAVHGIDISPALVAIARAGAPALGRRPTFEAMDCTRTRFDDGQFDLVFGNGILHHLELEPALAEVHRVLRPGGKAFFVEPLARHPLVALLRRATPRARSADERPLDLAEVAAAGARFCGAAHREYFLFAVLAAPLNLVSRRAARLATRLLGAFDQACFAAVPPARRFAWITLLTFEKGRAAEAAGAGAPGAPASDGRAR